MSLRIKFKQLIYMLMEALKEPQINALFYKLIQTICLIFTIYIIPIYLDNKSQGYYYLYLNLLSIQVFVELGLGTFLVNYSSSLKEGGVKTYSKLGSLLKQVIIYTKFNAVFFVIIALIYIYIFGDIYLYNDNLYYTIIYILIISLDISRIPIISIVSGCGDIVEVYRMKSIKIFFETLGLWTALALGIGVNALIVAASISLLFTIIFLKYIKRDFLCSIEKSFVHHEQINWMKDIFPMQWKMGISWISGWLLFSSFVPISFKLVGPIEAGQMGMTLSMILGLASISSMVINAIAPKMAKYAAARDSAALDGMVSKAAKISIIIYLFGAIIIILFSLYLESITSKYTGRFLPLEYLIFIIIGVGAQQFTMPITAYMFAYIKHPFVFESLLLGVLTITSLYISGSYFGIGGMTLSFMLIQIIVAVPIFMYKFWIFRRAVD